MLGIDINGVSYQVRTDWADNTVRQFNLAFNYLNTISEDLKKTIYPEEGQEDVNPTNEEIFKFYIDWIVLFSDIPEELLNRDIEITSERDVSLDQLFSLVSHFLYDPKLDEIEPKAIIHFGGNIYKLAEDAKSPKGLEKMLSGSTFQHFVEAQALANIFPEVKEDKFDNLARLTAILFREEGEDRYDESKVRERTNLFQDLPMSDIYSCYFFLSEHTAKLVKSLETSLAEEVAEAKREARVKKSSTDHTGKSKLSKWLRKVFLPNKD